MAVKYAGLHGVSIKFIGGSAGTLEKESRVADLQATLLHYLPEMSATIRKANAMSKLRFWGLGALCLHKD
jgi:hypothetical protein